MTNQEMYTEELYEEGIVKESKDGIATIVISNSDQCEECTAKLYCKPGSSNERSLVVKDPFGVKVGDKVKVMIKGSKLISASFIIYGIPLVLLLLGLIIGMNVFHENKEIYSTFFSFVLATSYLFIFWMIGKKEKWSSNNYPEIIFVSSKANQN
ncbi:MAG: SoxR reducing system RseC family protein [Ignavibacteriales bacterium]|nr:SoxR reducing system RseC family protein [Ignavibacteriales bacterium]